MSTQSNTIISFNALYEQNKTRFVRYAKSYVSTLEVAEDIVNDSFLYYWENKERIEETNILSYLLSVVRNKSLNYLRKIAIEERAKNHFKTEEEWETQLKIGMLEASNPEKLLLNEVQKLVQEALQEMPKRTREILILSRFQSKPHKEIAHELAISTKTVEYHISNALKVLRLHLKDYFLLWILFL